ncbi:MAG: aminopeptidase P family protein [Acidobacteria bacterium]|nr:aminopeptidase P family protein [Acidobacteriota bacterium]MBI3472538.1 aminopeptidase P family protein [Candidatus Solibacter usitatus]
MNLAEIQQELRKQQLDGWLFFDHHQRDPLAYRVLGFAPSRHVTRRWYYLIPASGEPAGLVHRIESGMLDPLPGEKRSYSSWTEQHDGLRAMLAGCRRVAMQYSPQCAIFYVSMVDAGTVELVRSMGVEISSSADLIQHFEARWTPAALESHLEAGRRVDRVRAEAFRMIGERLRGGGRVSEYEVQQFIREGFTRAGLFTDHGPIVGVNANASNPHYEPTAEAHSEIHSGDLVLIDLWAKLDQPRAVYYDITWTGVCGDPSDEMNRVFSVVREARDRAVSRVQHAIAWGEDLRGFEVDDAARGYIQEQGYGPYFTHRTGHSIGEDVHGSGANMDNLETHDERRVTPWTCFSVEPGIYLPKFGVRTEVNVFAGEDGARVTGEVQRELVIV